MTFSEELARLGELHQRGVLSDDEFVRAKARVLGDRPTGRGEGPLVGSLNAVRRSRADRWMAGVCGGLADSFGLAAWLWRLLFTVLALCGGAGVVLYVLLWFFVPEADGGPSAVRGEPA